ncbi:hypothetical protein [Belliella baltica]|nr:hypothetical protein [Belliella baltica]
MRDFELNWDFDGNVMGETRCETREMKYERQEARVKNQVVSFASLYIS